MAKYNVEVVETLSRVVEIEADSYEDAEAIAEEKYNNSDIILDWEDKEDTNYKPYPSQKISDDFVITIDFDKRRRDVYISTENSSGASYKCETEDDLKSAISTYISNYIELEAVMPEKDIRKKDKEYER